MYALWQQLERAARLRGDSPAIGFEGSQASWAWALDEAGRMARVLHDAGVTDGARVALISPNSLVYMLMPFAAEAAGGTFVPLNSRLAPEELVELASSRSLVALAVTDHDTVEGISRAVAHRIFEHFTQERAEILEREAAKAKSEPIA